MFSHYLPLIEISAVNIPLTVRCSSQSVLLSLFTGWQHTDYVGHRAVGAAQMLGNMFISLSCVLIHFRCVIGGRRAITPTCAQVDPAGSQCLSGWGSTRRPTRTSWSIWWTSWRWTQRGRWEEAVDKRLLAKVLHKANVKMRHQSILVPHIALNYTRWLISYPFTLDRLYITTSIAMYKVCSTIHIRPHFIFIEHFTQWYFLFFVLPASTSSFLNCWTVSKFEI